MPKPMSYIRAVNSALRWGLETYPQAIVFGEDVALPNGPFGATKGLHGEFGARVFDTPISESAMVGAALGAAMRGCRPVVEIMYMDFALVAMDQIVNQVANTRYVSRAAWTAPLVIRTQGGHSPGSCAQHSHAIEAFFAHTPGLRVGLPADADDGYQMLRTAIASDDPVMIVENRMLYADKRPVERDAAVQPLGGARTVRSGSDATIVAWSRTVSLAKDAAEQLAHDGLDVEVIDLRWLNPLDFDVVAESVGRTGRLVVAHEANVTGGFGAEIAARAAMHCFSDLRAPIQRVGTMDVPVPAAPALQRAVIPEVSSIVEAVRTTFGARAFPAHVGG